MAKVESKFIYENEAYALWYKKDNIKVFMNEDERNILVTTNQNEILFNVSADCKQNVGFIVFNEVE